MAFSAPRLTIYALLSATEEDLRDFVLKYLEAELDNTTLFGEDLQQRAERRYVDENGTSERGLSAAELVPYVDLGDLIELINRHRNYFPHDIRVHLKSMNEQILQLLPIRKRIAHIRPFRYDDLARVTSFTDQVSSSHSAHWPAVSETVARLGNDPSFIFELPVPPYEEPPDSCYNNLPLPEFDDTGFLGRASEVSVVLNLCKGVWPVVSLVGEGGLGKTALALRCAYEIVDDPHSGFEAVIWSSSKTTKLDPTQIREIDNAIRDSLGLFQSVAEGLGVPKTASDPLDEVLDYLQSFKVLLILDNLETVVDERVRSFLSRLPAGSKVLITSRIGIGEFEYRVNIQPLPKVDGARLLRAVASVSGVAAISRLPEHDLVDLSERMHNNPLFLKWFVAAIQAGLRSEELLVDPGLFLDFCMSNVYSHLSSAAQSILKILLAAPEELSLPELIYFYLDDAFETQAAAQELLTTNMLVMNSAPGAGGTTVETRYRLTDLTRQYLTRNHPLTPDEDRDLDRLRRRLEESQRRVAHQISGDKFDSRTITTRSKSDLLVVVPLMDAGRFAQANRFAEALDAVGRAKSLAPDYYECFRVEAQIHGLARNVAVADAAFRTALDLAPESAPLKLFYARFLREVRRNIDSALDEVGNGLKLATGEPQLLLEGVRCNIELLAFGAARDQISELLADPKKLSSGVTAEAWRLSAEVHVAQANFQVQTKSFADAMSSLEALHTDYETCPGGLRESLHPALRRSAGAFWCCQAESGDPGVELRAKEYGAWIRSLRRVHLPMTVRLADTPSYGVVKYYDNEKAFGFISSSDQGEVFFARSSLKRLDESSLLRSGTQVSYVLAAADRGRRAQDVALL